MRDHTTGRPIEGAQVVLVDASARDRSRTITDSLGLFRIVAAEPGEFTPRFERLGCTSLEGAPVRLERGEIVTVEARLSAGAIPLGPVLVIARTVEASSPLDAFRASAAGDGWGAFGQVITRAEIERHTRSTATELLRPLPQITLAGFKRYPEDTRERYRIVLSRHASTSCEPVIYLDGHPVALAPGISVDDFIDPNTLEGVEVHASFAPPGFAAGP
ncbi:MAG: Plug and carboxypeptidase regulatory-like domain-containing protein [Gemmatimonadetes bacterium]|nr:Plug and carboxypeptidase regulatory-like domain-containing protein [Gemmatimonadota bacterium]